MNQKYQYSILGFFFAFALICSTYIFGQAIIKAVPSSQVVKVRGVSERIIKSDRVNWGIKISNTNTNPDFAYSLTEDGIGIVKKFFTDKGIPSDRIHFAPYNKEQLTKRRTLDKLGNYEYKIIGYKVSRRLYVKNFNNLNLIEKLNQEFDKIMEKKGVSAQSLSPYFYYSKPMGYIKPDLLKEAAKNAYVRATIVAESSGSKLGPLRAARQGAFNGFSDDGMVGGSTREHRITALVTVDYALD